MIDTINDVSAHFYSEEPNHTGATIIDAAGSAAATDKVERVERQGYRIGTLQLLVKFDVASELLPVPPIYRLPGTPASYMGVANLHGNVVPIFNLHSSLGQQAELARAKDRMVLVLGHNDSRAGVLINGLPTRKSFSAIDTVSAEEVPAPLREYVMDAWLQQDGIWVEIHHERLLDKICAELI